jgi:uncharacterized membrane protein YhfC
MLEIAYITNFLGMVILPVIAWIYFSRRFKLSWKYLLAGGLTFIASQIPHLPLTVALTPLFKSWGNIAYAITLGLLAGLFEETARFILFKFILKKARSWRHGIFVGLGHGGTEAIILGVLAGLTFVTMIAYRNIDLSTVIPAAQLETVEQQVAAYWSTPIYIALLGMVERIFAICLHVAFSVMVLYGITTNKPAWYGMAVLWHAAADGLYAYLGSIQIGALSVEGVMGLLAIVSVVLVLAMRRKFPTTPKMRSMEISTLSGDVVNTARWV